MCQYAKAVKQIFEIWILNFLANFVNFKFGRSLSLELQQQNYLADRLPVMLLLCV